MTSREDLINQVNQEQAADLNMLALEQRDKILTLSGYLLTSFLLDQIEKHAQVKDGDVKEFFVGQDLECIPDRGREIGRKSVSFMVEGMNLGLQRKERLRILMPVSTRLDLNDERQVGLLAKPKEIYTERSHFEDNATAPTVYSRHIIDDKGIMMYALDDDDFDTQKGQPGFEQLLYGRVEEQLVLLVRLRQDIINWDNQPQLRAIQGLGQVEDL